MNPLVARLIVAVATTALVAQFLVSGMNKLMYTRTCGDAKIMERVFGPHCPFNVTVLIFAGVWEVVSSLVVLGTTYLDTQLQWRRIALVSLVVFTVLATLMFKRTRLGIMANVSVAGGLGIAAIM